MDDQLEVLFSSFKGELTGLAVSVNDREGIIYSGSCGFRSREQALELPMTVGTICRVASLSKIVTALVAAELSVRGEFDIREDISHYLGYPVRNPHFPETPLTTLQLLGHRSSLRDGGEYNLPAGVNIRSSLEGNSSLINWSQYNGPGNIFAYCNLGYGVIATVLEAVTGESFDRLADRIVLSQLRQALIEEGFDGKISFNLTAFSDEDLVNCATLYRKESPGSEWTATRDRYASLQEEREKHRKIAGINKPGTNGTLFAPQGGMRASAESLAGLNRLLLGRGTLGTRKILSEKTVDLIMEEQWRFDPSAEPEPGSREMGWGFVKSCGAGLFKIINSSDTFGSDSLLPGGGPLCYGHHGDAYGFKGGLFFDPEEGLGYTYLISGTHIPEDKARGKWSVNTRLEEEIQALIIKSFWKGYRV